MKKLVVCLVSSLVVSFPIVSFSQDFSDISEVKRPTWEGDLQGQVKLKIQSKANHTNLNFIFDQGNGVVSLAKKNNVQISVQNFDDEDLMSDSAKSWEELELTDQSLVAASFYSENLEQENGILLVQFSGSQTKEFECYIPRIKQNMFNKDLYGYSVCHSTDGSDWKVVVDVTIGNKEIQKIHTQENHDLMADEEHLIP